MISYGLLLQYKLLQNDAKVFDQDGFLHAGDMGRLEDDGSLVIVGRKKEMYIRRGENVYPPAIEKVICKRPEVMLAAVLAVRMRNGARLAVRI